MTEARIQTQRPGHPVWVRITHWLGAAAFCTLVVSGVAILLALPRLFWGETGSNASPAWIVLPLPTNIEQTGWGRNLHFMSAWILVIAGAVYLVASVFGGRLRGHLLPERAQLRPGHILAEARAHLRFGGSRHDGATDRQYNVLQKFAYLAVIVILAPLMVLTGLTMSPGVTAAHPELFWMFGGRQSARTIHFLSACVLLAFVAVHVWQVLVNDPRTLLRGMLTRRGDRRS
jgi:thiosulfate reductase cytochrome b subunit